MALRNYQVLQRGSDNTARVVLSDGREVVLQAGGPYELDGAHDVYVGDIWILAGQSNMEGCGKLIDVFSGRPNPDLETPTPEINVFELREEWAPAQEPLHWLSDSPRNIHFRLWGLPGAPAEPPPHDPNRQIGAGLGLTFATTVFAETGVPIGLVPSAHGGTSMTQWDPDRKDEGGDSLYGATFERFKAVGGKVAGILWYQGESDCRPEDHAHFANRFTKIIAGFRRDFNQPELPFYYVQLGRFAALDAPDSVPSWNAVREAQRKFVTSMPAIGVVSAIDLELDDCIHISTHSLKRLGQRLARLVLGGHSPELEQVTLEKSPLGLHLRFRNVTGRLLSAGRPTGFSIRDDSGTEIIRAHKVVLDEDTVIVLFDTDPLPSGLNLWYGWGMDPYCNITDSADLPIPAFGPIPFPRF